MDIELQHDAKTRIFINADGQIVICQPDEPCAHCSEIDSMYLAISAHRARIVAKALIDLADEIEREANDR